MPATAVVGGLLSIGSKLIDRVFPDPAQRDQARLALLELEQSGELRELEAASGIIQTEAASEHVITATWRPLTMLFLVALIGAHWVGLTPENLADETVAGLLDLVKIGLGGYVVGRSAEKTAKAWKGNA